MKSISLITFEKFDISNLRLALPMALCAFTFGLYIHYTLGQLYFNNRLRQQRKGKIPPILPHFLPVFGSIVSYIRDPLNFIDQRVAKISKGNPVAVQIGTNKVFLVFGSHYISKLFQNSSLSTSTAMYYYVLANLFGMPKKAAVRITKDNSGSSQQPLPGTSVEMNNRIDYLVLRSILKFLQGPGMDPYYRRFASSLTSQMAGLDLQSSWSSFEDFWMFVAAEMTPASLEAMCGPFLMSRNPGFCRDFWHYIDAIPSLLKGYPRFFNRAGNLARESILDDIKAWHAWARANCDGKKQSDLEQSDPFWGSSFIRERQSLFLAVDDFDYDALAAEDLGAIFAANANTIPSAFWALYYVFRDPDLLARARKEVDLALKEPLSSTDNESFCPSLPNFDIAILMRQPLLQSIFAETLRLRTAVYMVRYTDRQELDVGDWKFPKHHAILVPSLAAHLDKSVWNQGTRGEYPVEAFWAERFLVHSLDTGNRSEGIGCQDSVLGEKSSDEGRTHFTLSGMKSAWIPFGGGPRICPGRHVAKREILLIIALMVTMFDIRFMGDDPGVNKQHYGTGAQIPARRLPFQIRRRTK